MRFRLREIVLAVRASLRSYLLDTLPPTAFAAAPRKLATNYTGPAMRVRRNSDNAEADIGFLANGDLDTFALMNHVGAENLLTWSEDFSNAAWTKLGVGVSSPVVTTNTVSAPDGSLTADTISIPAVSGGNFSFLYQQKTLSAAIHAESIKLKGSAGGEVIWLMWTSPGYTSVSMQCVLTVDWQTFQCPFNATAGSSNYIQIGVDLRDPLQSARPAQTFYAWGAQLNAGPVALDYCRTTSAPTVSGSGFVTKMYDQSGNARDLVQATAANQPRIVNAGLIDRITTAANRPGVRADGNTWLQCDAWATGGIFGSAPSTVNAVASSSSTADQDLISWGGATGNTLRGIGVNANTGVWRGMTAQDTGTGVLASVSSSITEVFSGLTAVGNVQLSVNGGISLNNAAITENTNPTPLHLFSRSTTQTKFVGGASDVIIFPSALSTADRLALESNQKSYYGTP